MIRAGISYIVLLALLALLAASPALAQDVRGAGDVEITSALLGGGLMSIPSQSGGPQTRNYLINLAVTRNIGRWIGVEGGGGIVLGRHDAHALYGTVSPDQAAASMLLYGADLVINPFRRDRMFVPYLAGGAGGLRVFDAPEPAGIDLAYNSSHLTLDAGGGVRWFPTAHYGWRAEYRFVDIRRAAAPLHAHLVYGGVVLTF